MAPPAKRQRLDRSHFHYDLTEALSRFPEAVPALNAIQDKGLPEEMNPLQPLLKSIAQAASRMLAMTPEPSYQASNLTLRDVRDKLGIDFQHDNLDYMWSLTEEQKGCSTRKPLSPWAGKFASSSIRGKKAKLSINWLAATAIETIKNSPRFSKFQREASVRTLCDILLADRLNQLDDSNTNNQLCVGYEVPMTAVVQGERGGGKIPGRADWSLGYMSDLDKLEQMLVVIEAKFGAQMDNSMAQLLAYMYAVHDARVQADKVSSAVFGILTDFTLFRFVVLRQNGKVLQSEILQWAPRHTEVVAFLDNILLDAIKSSPHTTPQKTANRTIKNFDRRLLSTYSTPGNGEGDTGVGEDDEESGDSDAFDVVKINGVSLLVPCRR
jgi:hypothetical protein